MCAGQAAGGEKGVGTRGTSDMAAGPVRVSKVQGMGSPMRTQEPGQEEIFVWWGVGRHVKEFAFHP